MSTFADGEYARQGGAATLGYPKGPRLNGLPGTGWMHLTEKGCLVYSPASGAWGVTEIRWTTWVRNGREKGVLGYPIGANAIREDRSWMQLFQKGCIVDSAATTTSVVYGPRWDMWVSAGREYGTLGFPVASVQPLYTGAWIQRFQRGCITDGPATTPALVTGATWVAWQQVGREKGPLGFPAASLEVIGGGTAQRFEKGGIWGRTEAAAWAVHGPVLSAWEEAGGPGGAYGFPTAHVVDNGDGTYTGVFEGGSITA